MATIGNLAIMLSANTAGLSAGLTSARNDLTMFVRSIDDTLGGIARLSGTMLGVGSMMQTMQTGVTFAVNAEQAHIAFETLLKSGDAAKAMLDDLTRLAAETPFSLPQVRASAQQLLAFRFEAADIIPMLRIIGDAASASPQGMAEGLERIGRAIGQMKGRTNLATQELNQLTEAGIDARGYVAQALGVTRGEMEKMLESGAISASTGVVAILQGMEREFGGLMQRQSTTTLGMFSTLKDNIGMTLGGLAEEVMQAMGVQQGMQSLIAFTDAIRSNLGSVRAIVEATIVPAMDAVGAAFQAVRGFAEPLFEVLAIGWRAISPLVQPLIDQLGQYTTGLAQGREFGLAFFETLGVGVSYVAEGMRVFGGVLAQYVIMPLNQGLALIVSGFAQVVDGVAVLMNWLGQGGESMHAFAEQSRAMAAAFADQGRRAYDLGAGLRNFEFGQGAEKTRAVFAGMRADFATTGAPTSLAGGIGATATARDAMMIEMKAQAEAFDAGMEQYAAAVVKRDAELRKKALKIVEDTRSPLETYTQQMRELQELFEAGHLTRGQFEAASFDAFGKLAKDGVSAYRPNQALIAGSAEAFSAAVQHQQGSPSNDPQDVLRQIQQQQLRKQEIMADHLAKLAEGGAAIIPFRLGP
jgi:tape measure domain-containing protein